MIDHRTDGIAKLERRLAAQRRLSETLSIDSALRAMSDGLIRDMESRLFKLRRTKMACAPPGDRMDIAGREAGIPSNQRAGPRQKILAGPAE